jgi:serine phosphatase RsbU (regulator of sigma subunit)
MARLERMSSNLEVAHPPSIVLTPGESKPLLLPSAGLIMGVMGGVKYPAQSCRVPSGARLLIFSDGVFEIFRDGRATWNLNDCIDYLASLGQRQGSLIDDLLHHVRHLCGSPQLEDDFSVIEAQFR